MSETENLQVDAGQSVVIVNLPQSPPRKDIDFFKSFKRAVVREGWATRIPTPYAGIYIVNDLDKFVERAKGRLEIRVISSESVVIAKVMANGGGKYSTEYLENLIFTLITKAPYDEGQKNTIMEIVTRLRK